MNRKTTSKTEFAIYMLLVLAFYTITLFHSSGLTSMLLMLILVCSSIYAYRAYTQYNLPQVMKALILLLVMFSIYGFFLILSGKTLYISEVGSKISNRIYLLQIYQSLLPIFAFFIFTKRGLLTEKRMRMLFLVFFVIAVVNYFNNRMLVLDRALETNEYATDVTNNAGYEILSLIPFLVFFDKRPYFRYIILIICGGLILYSIKRGAILTFVVCLLYYLPKLLKYSSKWTRYLTIIATVVVGVYAYQYITDFIASNTYFSNRLDSTREGELGARSLIWASIIEIFMNGNYFQLLFGRGAWATLEVTSNFAHNDWLEILINQGWVGICLFAYYWLLYYKMWRRLESKPTIFILVGLLFLSSFIRCFFSMSISDMSIYASCLTGYAFAQYSNYLQQQQIAKVLDKEDKKNVFNF